MFRILKAEITMLIGEIKEYYLNYIFYNIGIIVLFFGIFYNNYKESSELDVLCMILYAVVWQICTNSTQYLSYLIQDEAMMGTLEQMFLTKTSFSTVVFSKTLVNLAFALIKGIVLFFVCSLLFGILPIISQISFSQFLLIFCSVIFVSISFCCIGGFFGGLSLYFKRISSMLGVFEYFLLMFTGIVSNPSGYARQFYIATRVIPITNANFFIHDIVFNSINIDDSLIFLFSGIIFSLLGLLGFYFLIAKAKKDGKLGQY